MTDRIITIEDMKRGMIEKHGYTEEEFEVLRPALINLMRGLFGPEIENPLTQTD